MRGKGKLGLVASLALLVVAAMSNQAVASTPSDYSDLIYAGGHYVVTTKAGLILESDDGVTWNTVFSDPVHVYSMTSVTYGNGIYLALGYGPSTMLPDYTNPSAVILKSTDGINWSVTSMDTLSQPATELAYGKGVFVYLSLVDCSADGFCEDPPQPVLSTDGVHWTTKPIQADIALGGYPFGFGAGQFLTFHRDSSGELDVYTSTDAVNWARTSHIDGSRGLSFARLRQLGKGFGAVGSSKHPALATSLDGVSWTVTVFDSSAGENGLFNILADGQINDISRSGATTFITNTGAGNLSQGLFMSTDGTNWCEVSTHEPDQRASLIASSDSQLAAITSDGLFFSLDTTPGTLTCRKHTNAVGTVTTSESGGGGGGLGLVVLTGLFGIALTRHRGRG